MALERIVIEVSGDPKKLKSTISELEKVGAIDKKNSDQFQKNNKKYLAGVSKADKATSSLSGTLTKIGPVLAGAFAIGSVIEIGNRIKNTTAEFQKFAAVLENTLGSRSKAQKALQDIQDFASSTPFQVDEITGAFVKLANQGFTPTTEELRKLGDIAASTGKSFDQLAEAIIDAQVGEFERLKEFGIRASKQGDQVKFTFKGVEQQVKFTSTAIQDYVLSLGDVAGVSGAMNKISKTLGGQISNMEDNITLLQKALGERLAGAFGDAVTSVNGLIKKFTELVEVPVSEKMEEERIAFRGLELQIFDTNIPAEERVRLINEMKLIYPELLADIDAETISNDELAKKLTEVNDALVNRIIIQKKQEEIKVVAEKVADRIIKREEALRNQSVKNVEIAKEFGLVLQRGLSVEEQRANLQRQLIPLFNDYGIAVDRAKRAYKELGEESYRYAALGRSLADLQPELNELMEQQIDRQSKLGTEVGLAATEWDLWGGFAEEAFGTLNDGTKDVDEAETQLELLTKRLSEVKKELLNQSLAGKITKKSLKDFEDITEQLTTAQEKLKKALSGTTDEAKKEAEAAAAAAEKAAEEARIKMDASRRERSNKRDAAALKWLEEQSDRQKKEALLLQDVHALAIDLKLNEKDLLAEFEASGFKTFKEFEEKKREEIRKTTALIKTEEEERNEEILQKLEFASAAGAELFNIAAAAREQDLIDLEKQKEAELEIAGDNEAAREDIEDKFAEKTKAIKRQQAVDAKAAAIFDIVLNTAKNIVAAGVNIPLAVMMAVVGALQLAAVAARPIPKFEEGGWIGGERHARGGTLLEAEKDEFIVNRVAAKRNKGLLEDLNRGELIAYNRHRNIAGTFADNVANSMTFNDMNLLRAIKKASSKEQEGFYMLSEALKQDYNPRVL
jgi:hypothetical protein